MRLRISYPDGPNYTVIASEVRARNGRLMVDGRKHEGWLYADAARLTPHAIRVDARLIEGISRVCFSPWDIHIWRVLRPRYICCSNTGWAVLTRSGEAGDN